MDANLSTTCSSWSIDSFVNALNHKIALLIGKRKTKIQIEKNLWSRSLRFCKLNQPFTDKFLFILITQRKVFNRCGIIKTKREEKKKQAETEQMLTHYETLLDTKKHTNVE